MNRYIVHFEDVKKHNKSMYIFASSEYDALQKCDELFKDYFFKHIELDCTYHKDDSDDVYNSK